EQPAMNVRAIFKRRTLVTTPIGTASRDIDRPTRGTQLAAIVRSARERSRLLWGGADGAAMWRRRVAPTHGGARNMADKTRTSKQAGPFMNGRVRRPGHRSRSLAPTSLALVCLGVTACQSPGEPDMVESRRLESRSPALGGHLPGIGDAEFEAAR